MLLSDCRFPVPSACGPAGGDCWEGWQSGSGRLESADLVVVLLLECGDCDAFFFADRGAALEGLAPLPGFEVRGVEIHIRHDGSVYDGESDVDKMGVFHGWLDGGNGLWGDLSFFECFAPRFARRKTNLVFLVVRAKARTYLKSKYNSKCEKQIPPLRCGMTTKRTGNSKSKCDKKEQATAKAGARKKEQATAKASATKKATAKSGCATESG